ncbi:MAG: PAS domain S-box protein [Breznakibacter sp.]
MFIKIVGIVIIPTICGTVYLTASKNIPPGNILDNGNLAFLVFLIATSAISYAVIRLSVPTRLVKSVPYALTSANEHHLDTAQIVVVAVDVYQRVTYINPKGAQMLGYDRSELIGKSWVDLCNVFQSPPLATILDAMGKEGQMGKHRHIESAILTKDGSPKYVTWYNSFMVDTNNQVAGILMSGIDVSDIHPKDNEHWRNKTLFFEAIKYQPNAIAIAVNNKVIHHNLKFIELFGYTLEDVPTIDRWMELAYPDDDYRTKVSANWNRMIAESQKSGASTPVKEYLVTCKDNSNKTVEISGRPVGEMFVTAFNDITERKLAEEKIGLLSLAIDQSSASVLVTDKTGCIVYVNHRFETITGYKQEEVIGSNPRMLKSGHHPAEFYQTIWKTILSGKIWKGQFHNKKKNGSLYWESASIAPIYNHDGIITHFVGVKEDLTEKIIAERILEEAQIKLRAVIDSTSDLIWAVRPFDFGLIMFNEPLKKHLFKRFAAQIDIGDTPYNIFPSVEEADVWIQRYQKALQEGNYIIKATTSDNRIHFEYSFNLLTNEKGVFAVSCFARNITDLHLAEQAVKNSEERLQKLLESVTDFIYSASVVNGQFIGASHSEGCFSVTGYSTSEFGKTRDLWQKIIFPDDLKQVQIYTKSALINNLHDSIEHRIIHRDGNVKWVRNTIVAKKDNQGLVIGYDSLISDITTRKTAEDALRISEERYRTVTTLSGHVIYDINLDNHKVLWTGAVESVLGYSESEFSQPGPLFWEEITCQEDKTKVTALFKELVHGKKPFKAEYRLVTKDGTTKWIDNQCYILPLIPDNPARAIGVIKDVTLKKDIERQILSNVIKAEEKERINFSQEIHDGLGPLLSAIKMYAQWLSIPNTRIDRDEVHKDLEKLINEATQTVRDISFKLSPHVLRSYGLIEAVKSYVERIAQSTNLKVNFIWSRYNQIDGNYEFVLYRVLCESANNTIKHANASQAWIRIHQVKHMTIVVYHDNGRGFDIDQTIHSPKGIGLLNMQSRINSLGGHFVIKSRQNKGTTIKIKVNTSG